MTQTIWMVDALATRIAEYCLASRLEPAERTYHVLRGLPNVTDGMLASIESAVGELCLNGQEYERACGYLYSSVRRRPDARTFYSLGIACEYGPDVNLRHVRRCYGKAVELEWDNPRYLSTFGEIVIRMRSPHSWRSRRDLNMLLVALSLDPHDDHVRWNYVRALLTLGRLNTAELILRRMERDRQVPLVVAQLRHRIAMLRAAPSVAHRHRTIASFPRGA